MTILGKTFVFLMLTAAFGAGTYEAYQASELRGQVQTIKRQQAPLAKQIRELRRERDEATNRLARLLTENVRSKSNSPEAELLKLRTEAAKLSSMEAQPDNDPDESAVDTWVNRVSELKQYVTRHPDESIPEFQFLTDREWLLIAAPERTGTDWSDVMQDLKSQAEPRFAAVVRNALEGYSRANNGAFPADLTQLQPYCDPNVEDILQQRYEIKPASVLPADSVKALGIKTDWVIAGKEPIAANTADHIAIYTNGYTFFW